MCSLLLGIKKCRMYMGNKLCMIICGSPVTVLQNNIIFMSVCFYNLVKKAV